MKKLLIATTALVATAGMASADITITGHAAAGIYSGLSNKDAKAKTTAPTSSKNLVYLDVATNTVTSPADTTTVQMATSDVLISGTDAVATVTAATVGTYSGDGIYSNAGVDFTMSGATDNGISFSAAVNVDAGMEVDTGDFELDGKDGGTAGLGSVSMTGAFGTSNI